MRLFIAVFLNIFFLLSSLNVFSAGFTVRNGAGLAEFNVEYGSLQLPQLLRFCVEQGSCDLTVQEKSLARQLSVLEPSTVEFLDDRSYDKIVALSEVNGTFKINTQGAIFVKQSALYPEHEPISSFESMTALIELLASTKIQAGPAAVFAQKIMSGSQMISENLSMKSFGIPESGFSFLKLSDKPVLFFRDSERSLLLTPGLEQALECPQGTATLQQISKMKWSSYQPEASGANAKLYVASKVEYLCPENGGLTLYQADLSTQLVLTVLNGEGKDILNGKVGTKFKLSHIDFETAFIEKK